MIHIHGLLRFSCCWVFGSLHDVVFGMQTRSDVWSTNIQTLDLSSRATLHGSGINRFWTRVEGYKGPLLMLMEATSEEGGEEKSGKWVVGAFVPGGFDNKEVFYGSSSCCLFAVAPHLSPYRSTGLHSSTSPDSHFWFIDSLVLVKSWSSFLSATWYQLSFFKIVLTNIKSRQLWCISLYKLTLHVVPL